MDNNGPKSTLKEILCQLTKVLGALREEANPTWGGDMDYVMRCQESTTLELNKLEDMINHMQE